MMNSDIDQILHLQKLLWRWMWTLEEGKADLGRIRRQAKRIWEQYFPDETSSRYLFHLFYPLIGKGIIEWYGENEYGLTPSSVLIFEDNWVTINGSETLHKTLEYQALNTEVLSIGVKRFHIRGNHDLVEGLNVRCEKYQPGMLNFLKKFPSIQSIILNLDPAPLTISSTGTWYDLRKKAYHNTMVKPGLYRRQPKSGFRWYWHQGEEQWYTVPERQKSPDILNLCASYQLNLEPEVKELKYINYSKDDKSLSINYAYFPYLLERAIRCKSYLTGGKCNEGVKRKNFTSVSPNDFAEIYRILKSNMT